MKRIITIAVLMFIKFSAFSQNVELSNQLIEKYKQGQIKASLKSASVHDHLWLTPILKDVVLNWDNLTDEAKLMFQQYRARPTLKGTEQTKTTGNFVFHYSTNGGAGEQVSSTDANSNGIPDYVDNMMAKFTEVYALYHTTSGFTVPPADGNNGGDSKYDVYISGDIAGANIYGYVQPASYVGNNANSSTLTEKNCYNSYMVMRNNYSGFGVENIAISVTAAHEYMHAIQFGYSSNIDSWLMEACATWAEDIAYPGYDDNLQYIEYIYRAPDVALNLEDGEASGTYDSHWYGVWIFMKYMTEHTNNSLIKKIYERSITQTSLSAIDTELSASWSSNLKTMFTQFAIANALMSSATEYAPYTYARASVYKSQITADGGFFYDNNAAPFNFTGTTINWDSQNSGNKRLMRLGADYFKMTATGNFKITFATSDASTETKLYLIKATANSVSVVEADAEGIVNVTDQAAWTQFIPVVVRYDAIVTTTDPQNYTIAIEAINATGIAENKSNAKIYPNPVADVLNVSVPRNEKSVASIVDMTGKTVLTQHLTNTDRIDVSQLENGIYFLHITNDNSSTRIEKIVVLH